MEVINVKWRIGGYHQELSIRTNSGLPSLFITSVSLQYVNTNNPVCPQDYPRIIHSILLFFLSHKRLLWLTGGSSFHSLKLIIVSWDLQMLITIDNTLRYSPLFLMVPSPSRHGRRQFIKLPASEYRLISRNFPSKERVEDYNETLFKLL